MCDKDMRKYLGDAEIIYKDAKSLDDYVYGVYLIGSILSQVNPNPNNPMSEEEKKLEKIMDSMNRECVKKFGVMPFERIQRAIELIKEIESHRTGDNSYKSLIREKFMLLNILEKKYGILVNTYCAEEIQVLNNRLKKWR